MVGADGRSSDMARLAKVPTLRSPHRRFAYYAYFRELPLVTGQTSQLWFLNPDVAYAFATDDGLTLMAYWPHKRDLATIKADVEGQLRTRFAALEDGPDLDAGTRVSPWVGKLDMPNLARPASFRGMALVGDAAAAHDPLWGVGCGWAMQSAEWLASSVGVALASGGPLELGLRAYRRRHLRETGLAHLLMADYSLGRPFLPPEMLMFSAAARDPETEARVHRFAARVDPPHRLFSPRAIGRALRVAAGCASRSPRPAPTSVRAPAS